jgi:hypothetical protein
VDRIQNGDIPQSIQDLIGPVEEKDVGKVIDVLRRLKGDSPESFQDLSPEEKRAFARSYLQRTGSLNESRRSGFGGGALVLGALALVGGYMYYQTTTQGVPPAEEGGRPGQPDKEEETGEEPAEEGTAEDSA